MELRCRKPACSGLMMTKQVYDGRMSNVLEVLLLYIIHSISATNRLSAKGQKEDSERKAVTAGGTQSLGCSADASRRHATSPTY